MLSYESPWGIKLLSGYETYHIESMRYQRNNIDRHHHHGRQLELPPCLVVQRRKRRITTLTVGVASILLYGETSLGWGPIIPNNGLRSSSHVHTFTAQWSFLTQTGLRMASSSSSSLLSSTRDDSNCDDRDPAVGQVVDTSPSTSTTPCMVEYEEEMEDPTDLQAQADMLRREADELRRSLEESKRNKIQREVEKVDKWIDELLVEMRVDENTDLLKTVDAVLERLRDDRYSAEQVNKIFKRLCEIRQQESRSDCSPLMDLLVDAAGKLDCIDREDNPNKRWSGRVERTLRKKLFARDWNIHLEDDDDDDARNPWRIR